MNPQPISNSQFLEALKWRYATKSFDPNRKISAEHWDTLLQTILLAPTSFGLQPFRVLVIENPDVRAQIQQHAWNQKQVVEASHLLVFLAKTSIDEAFVKAHVARVATNRNATEEMMSRFKANLTGLLLTEEFKPIAFQWSARQAYIALADVLMAAALLRIDACPMEGFIRPEVDKILGLSADSGYSAAVLCALGYRAMDDRFATYPKLRRLKEEIIETV